MKELLKSDKLLKIAFIAGIAAIALIFLSSFGGGSDAQLTEEQMLEQRITQMLAAWTG